MILIDTQAVLLAAAAARDTGSLVPVPAAIKAPAAGVARSFASLISKRLAEEREVTDAALVHRTEGDVRLGVFITAAGKHAIGIVEGEAPSPAPAAPAAALATPAPERQTKAALVLGLLQRESGATLPELIEATGWLPHTTRAALTGLRKKGHALEKTRRDDVTCYRVVAG